MTPLDIGDRIRNRRRDLGLSQGDLASQAGVSRSFVYRLESGDSDGIGLAGLFRVVDALDLRFDLVERECMPTLDDLVEGPTR